MIRVLVVDDSAVVREALTDELNRETDIEVVGTAVDPYAARDKIVALKPDVVTLDIEMPRMDGLTFLNRLMHHHPLPVVIVSSLATEQSEVALRALALGAVDVVAKPSQWAPPDIPGRLARAVRAAAAAKIRGRRTDDACQSPAPLVPAPRGAEASCVIAMGASTGGTIALESLLRRLPATAPPVLIVQHMPPGFTEAFSRRLDHVSAMQVREAKDMEAVLPGVALLAPAGRHMVLQPGKSGYHVRVKEGPPVHFHRPSVDVLFRSVARGVGPDAIGVLLTGMGADGAAGLLEMRNAGAHTIAEAEESCVVFGMSRKAIELGAAAEIVDIDKMPQRLSKAWSKLEMGSTP